MTIPHPNIPVPLDFLEIESPHTAEITPPEQEEVTKETRLKLHQWLAVILIEYIRHH